MKQLIKYLLAILGFFMFTYFIWLRFIRERLPKDIPFDLSIIGFIILVYICWIYFFIVISYFYKYKFNPTLLLYLIDIIYKPLLTLDEIVKTNHIIKPYYKRSLIYFVNICKIFSAFYKKEKKRYDYIHLVYIFQIFPRIVLISALCIDTFYFHQLYYSYKVIPIGLLLVIYRYVLYSFKYAKEQYILRLEYMVEAILTNYYNPEDDPIGEYKTHLNVRRFIDEQTFSIMYDEHAYTFSSITSNEYNNDYKKHNNLPITYRLTFQDMNIMDKEFYEIMEILVPLSVHIDEYEFRNENYLRIKNTIKIMFILYLISWVYILIISIYALPMDTYINMWDWIIQEMPRIKEESIEPFTGIELEIESGKSKLGSILNRVE